MTDPASIAARVFAHLGKKNGTRETATYVALPGNGAARWLLPLGRPETASVLASWSPYRLRSRVAWSAVRWACRAGALARIPATSELEVACPCAMDWEEVGWRNQRPPIPVIYLGTMGPRRKAIVHLVEQATGKCQAVVKVPLTVEAKLAVLREAEVLAALEAEGFAPAPRVLYVDRTKGITTQTFVEGRSGPRRMNPGIWQLLRSLLLPGETMSLSAYADRWAKELGDGGEDSQITCVLHELQGDDSPLPACREHGDFAPWNIRRSFDGPCMLIDWEDAQRNSLPLQDAFHFLHMQDFVFGAEPALHAQDICAKARDMELTPGQCCKLEATYLTSQFVQCAQRKNLERQRFLSATLARWRRRDG